MTIVRLVRAVSRPTGTGPGNGQYALQRALRARNLPWLRIDGHPCAGEIAWFWCWEDALPALRWAARGEPLLLGPNIFFVDSRRPGAGPAERGLLETGSCRMIFTESSWYAGLIRSHLGRRNTAPIVIWPYPIEPMPPLPSVDIRSDVLIYVKSHHLRMVGEELARRIPRSRIMRYGHFRRAELAEAAATSRACVYLSDDDRGPLALAEILCAGCPTVGIERGAPFVDDGANGVRIANFESIDAVEAAVERCWLFDREAIARRARETFAPETVASRVVAALGPLRRTCDGPSPEISRREAVAAYIPR